MSELKEYEVRIGRKLYQTLPPIVYVVADDNQPKLLNDKVYLKSEADKVIAELKDKLRHYPMMVALLESDKKNISELKKVCNDKDDCCLHTLKENRHHKYKRCLAMAWWCENAILGWMGHKESYSSHQQYIKVMLFTKWNKRWLELAEKFKEAK